MITEKILIQEPNILNPIDEPMVKFYECALSIAKSLSKECSFIETGTRSAHASMIMLKAIFDSGNKNRWLFTVDPYGDKPYGHGEHVSSTFDYGEQHYRNALYSLSKYSWENDLLHYHYRMRSQEFKFMSENVQFWYDQNKVNHVYGFIYLDGEHTFDAIMTELNFFLPKLVTGGMIVIDDILMIGDRIHELPIKGVVIFDKLFFTKL